MNLLKLVEAARVVIGTKAAYAAARKKWDDLADADDKSQAIADAAREYRETEHAYRVANLRFLSLAPDLVAMGGELERIAQREAVGAWHRSIFGITTIGTIRRVAMKTLEEASEFADANDPMTEAADVQICIHALQSRLEELVALRSDFDLSQAVEAKLAVLRDRGTSQIQRDLERGIPSPEALATQEAANGR